MPCQDVFVREFAEASAKATSKKHKSSCHKLPEKFSRILRPGYRPWKALTDETFLKAVAAWNWIHAFFRDYRAFGIGSSKMSTLMQPLRIVRQLSTQLVYASMGNYQFAALALRLHMFEVDGSTFFKFPFSDAEFEFLYVVAPTDWEAIDYIATRLPGQGLVMEQVGVPMPLIRHALRQAQPALTERDINMIIKLLHLEVADDPTLQQMFDALSKHFCDNPDEAKADLDAYVDAFEAKDDSDEKLLADPLLEAVYDNMDDEDKGEFREIGDAKRKKKYRARLGSWKQACEYEQRAKAAPRMRVRGKGKGRGKGRGKGKAPAPEVPAAPPPPEVPAAPPIMPLAPPMPPAPPPVLEPAPEVPLALEVPPAGPPEVPLALAPAAAVAAGNRAVASFGVANEWEDILCAACAKVAGQKKYSRSPGMRDPESWTMRCFDYEIHRWPTRLPLCRTQVQRTMALEPAAEIAAWVRLWKTCCRN